MTDSTRLVPAETAPILVGVDGSLPSIDALRYAGKLAEAMGVRLRVVTTWESPTLMPYHPSAVWSPEDDAAAVVTTAVREAFGDTPPHDLSTEILEGSPAKRLIEESRGARMLVLGTRGAGGFARLLLGSVSAACSAHAHCPVMLVRVPAIDRERSEEPGVHAR
jgi:nucleotide-binding universal stress UspA family protein